jgi:hypothetical protein
MKRTRTELTCGGPLSPAERALILSPLSLAERAIAAELERVRKLEDLQRRADVARAAGAGQASGPEELGP